MVVEVVESVESVEAVETAETAESVESAETVESVEAVETAETVESVEVVVVAYLVVDSQNQNQSLLGSGSFAETGSAVDFDSPLVELDSGQQGREFAVAHYSELEPAVVQGSEVKDLDW